VLPLALIYPDRPGLHALLALNNAVGAWYNSVMLYRGLRRQGVLHHAVPDVPVVDEDENAARRLAVDMRARDPAADRDLLQAQANGVQLAPVAGAEHLHDAVERVGGGRPSRKRRS